MNKQGGRGDWEGGDGWDEWYDDNQDDQGEPDEWDSTLEAVAMMPGDTDWFKQLLARGTYLFIPGEKPVPSMARLLKATGRPTMYKVRVYIIRKYRVIYRPIPEDRIVDAKFLCTVMQLPDATSHRAEFRDNRTCLNLSGILIRPDRGNSRLVVVHVDFDAGGNVVWTSPIRYVATLPGKQ